MSRGDVVVVTGGAGGIGTTMAEYLIADGYRVVALDRDEAGLGALSDRLDGRVATRVADATDEASVHEAFVSIASEVGPPYSLINLAGTNLVATIEETSLADFQRILTLSLTTTFLCSRAVIPYMRELGRGRIVNTSSIFGIRGETQEVAYSTAKAGIIGFTRALAMDLATSGITVNAVAPVATLTPRVAGFDPKFLERQLAQIPMGRFGETRDIAATVRFLLSDEADFFTGQVFSANGGDTMP